MFCSVYFVDFFVWQEGGGGGFFASCMFRHTLVVSSYRLGSPSVVTVGVESWKLEILMLCKQAF